VAALAPAYRPRRPTETILYAIVRDHLATFLAHAHETYSAPLPRYVQDELRGYLRCGVFAHGFVRAHCEACGHDLLVAFSCKARGVCPSCAGRRMANTAAHLVDRVLPAVPVRQWVLSLPFELRRLAAFDAEVLAALARIFAEALADRYRQWGSSEGLGLSETGAITFVQRFGSSLNLNVHLHVVVLDGVFVRDATENPVFHAAPPPSRGELDHVLERVHRRVSTWLVRHGHVDGSPLEARSNETPSPTPLDACADLAMQRGTTTTMRDDGEEENEEGKESGARTAPAHEAANHEGFNLHASVCIEAADDLGRERLCRYGARPPFSLERFRKLPGGRIGYRIKKARGGRAKLLVVTPLELLARIAALIPPPRYPLVRYHGVLAPRSSWRKAVIPRPPEVEATHAKKERHERVKDVDQAPRRQRNAHSSRGDDDAGHPPKPRAASAASDFSATYLAPNVIAVRHWERLRGGLLFATAPRIPWSILLRRTFDVDVLECAKCHGRLRVLGAVEDPLAARALLEQLGLPTDAPAQPRARDPSTLDGEDPTDDRDE
jgi:Putative transposase/Transposase zinc-binding domain